MVVTEILLTLQFLGMLAHIHLACKKKKLQFTPEGAIIDAILFTILLIMYFMGW